MVFGEPVPRWWRIFSTAGRSPARTDLVDRFDHLVLFDGLA
jgi:hypothetical protein